MCWKRWTMSAHCKAVSNSHRNKCEHAKGKATRRLTETVMSTASIKFNKSECILWKALISRWDTFQHMSRAWYGKLLRRNNAQQHELPLNSHVKGNMLLTTIKGERGRNFISSRIFREINEKMKCVPSFQSSNLPGRDRHLISNECNSNDHKIMTETRCINTASVLRTTSVPSTLNCFLNSFRMDGAQVK